MIARMKNASFFSRLGLVILTMFIILICWFGMSYYITLHGKVSTVVSIDDDNATSTPVFLEKETLTMNKIGGIDSKDTTVVGQFNLGTESLITLPQGENNLDNSLEVKNVLFGNLEFDEQFKVGDKIVIDSNKFKDQSESLAISYYRLPWITILISVFFILLLVSTGWIGLKAIFSFIGVVLLIGGLYVPSILAKISIIPLTIVFIMIITALIVFLVSGFNKKGISAFIGTSLGLVIALLVTYIWGNLLRLDGMQQAYSQALYFGGYSFINMKDLFFASVIIGASGACIDIAVDVCTSMDEVLMNSPNITRKNLFLSGINVGKSVTGTMATTLLLAYTGGFISLFVLFGARHTELIHLVNLKIVSAEILKTLAGSIALILVAPASALVASVILPKKNFIVKPIENNSIEDK